MALAWPGACRGPAHQSSAVTTVFTSGSITWLPSPSYTNVAVALPLTPVRRFPTPLCSGALRSRRHKACPERSRRVKVQTLRPLSHGNIQTQWPQRRQYPQWFSDSGSCPRTLFCCTLWSGRKHWIVHGGEYAESAAVQCFPHTQGVKG